MKKYTMSDKRKLQDTKRADLDRWIQVLKLKVKHPDWSNAEVGRNLKDPKTGKPAPRTRERVRKLLEQIGGRSVKEMINLKLSIDDIK